MTTRTPTFRHRLGAGCAAFALLPALLGPAAEAQGLPKRPATGLAAPDPRFDTPPPAMAHGVPPVDAAPAAALVGPIALEAEETPDPPSRVGRIARVQGTVSFRMPEQEAWNPAQVNFSLTSGNAIWTEPGARAALQIGRSNLVLDGATDLQFATIDETTVLATLPQGTVHARLRGLELGETVQIVTPHAQVTLDAAGRYLVEAGPGPDAPEAPLRIAVFEGSAVVVAEGAQPTRIGAGQGVLLSPGEPPRLIRASAVVSPLIAWAQQLEPRIVPPRSAALMTGVDDLGPHGRWVRSADYGDVWYPQVQADWAPYRDGQWVWREPWGWTWIDERPWRYTTSHYGRWVQIGPSWGWTPAPVLLAEPVHGVARPVWAPALVSFVGGAALGAAFAHWSRPVGSIPLGPREPYYPWYRASPRHVRNLNVTHVTNITQVTNTWNQTVIERRAGGPAPSQGGVAGGFPGGGPGLNPQHLRNRHAATAVPAETMIGSRPVRQAAQGIGPGALSNAAGPIGAPPVAPERQTLGVTPQAAQRLGLSAGGAAGGGAQAPGPAAARHAPLIGGRQPGIPGGGPGSGPAGAPSGRAEPAGPGGGPGSVGHGPGGAGAPGGGAGGHPGGGPGLGAVAGAAAAGAAAGAVGGAMLRPGPQLQPGQPIGTQGTAPGPGTSPGTERRALGLGPVLGPVPGLGAVHALPPGSPGAIGGAGRHGEAGTAGAPGSPRPAIPAGPGEAGFAGAGARPQSSAPGPASLGGVPASLGGARPGGPIGGGAGGIGGPPGGGGQQGPKGGGPDGGSIGGPRLGAPASPGFGGVGGTAPQVGRSSPGAIGLPGGPGSGLGAAAGPRATPIIPGGIGAGAGPGSGFTASRPAPAGLNGGSGGAGGGTVAPRAAPSAPPAGFSGAGGSPGGGGAVPRMAPSSPSAPRFPAPAPQMPTPVPRVVAPAPPIQAPAPRAAPPPMQTQAPAPRAAAPPVQIQAPRAAPAPRPAPPQRGPNQPQR